jgi:DNA-binding XRE family transcriptional regulator|nr:MAG TPA: SOS-response transcriptional repressor [Caudoviricetes sp.]
MGKRKIIHAPYNKFKGILRERGLTYADIAKTLNISETSVGAKVNGYSDFYISEVEKIEDKHNIGYQIFLK